jgi:hypothetical protein
MPPRVHSISTEGIAIRTTFPARVLSATFGAVAIGLAAAFFSGCSQSAWPEREGRTVDNASVDSLKILPIGSRYILADSLTALLFDGFHKGFTCSRVLEMGVEKRSSDSSSTEYRPKLSLQLPASAECPFDSGGEDSVAFHAFGADEHLIRLFGSAGGSTDEAPVVKGRRDSDSLVYVADSLKGMSKGRWVYQDTAAGAARMLRSDSLGPCERINQAEFRQSKDTTRVRYTWVTLDTCTGAVHPDSATVLPARP